MRIEEKESVLALTVSEECSGDFLVAVEARSEGFSGHADGHVVGATWRAFARQLADSRRSNKLPRATFETHAREQ